MKRSFVLFGSVLLIILIGGCKKNEFFGKPATNSLIGSSRSFFENQVLLNTSGSTNNNSVIDTNDDPGKWRDKAPAWENATVISISTGPAVLIPIYFKQPYLIQNDFSGKNVYSSNDVNQLLIYKDKEGAFHAEKLTFLPDSNYINMEGHAFSGIISVEAWTGEHLNRFKYGSDGKIQKYSGAAAAMSRKPELEATEKNIITVCYQSYGWNYAPNSPESGSYWISNLGCQSYYVDDQPNYGSTKYLPGSDYGSLAAGGSTGVTSSTKTFKLVNGDNPVTNILDYMKCYNNLPGNGNSYSITVCVEEPDAGSRQTWGFSGDGSSVSGNPVSVGHTFLILNQTNALGSTVRNIGFYPADGVSPLSPRSKGQINNDANHSYDISLTISMDNSQFFQVLNYVNYWADAGITYDLNSNNCTTFAVNALATAGINLPRTQGTWLNGAGLNPGDLGEDIRTMKLGPNMSKTSVTGTHPNTGFCY